MPHPSQQISFTDAEYASIKKVTRRQAFLSDIELLVPWGELEVALKPHYYSGLGPGRPPVGLGLMLRMYVAQQCLGLSDEGIEDALYDSSAVRRFVGLDLGLANAPDATTLLKFRHKLQAAGAEHVIFATISESLSRKGLLLKRGSIVDATLIAAAPSTKNQSGERDPEMHQTKKGNNWHFGMKAHIAVDPDSGAVQNVVSTAANVHDLTPVAEVLPQGVQEVSADSGYRGAHKREEVIEKHPKAKWHVAMTPGKRKALDKNTPMGQLQEQLETIKAKIRAKVEHPFHVVKNLFKHKKARYRGLAKNDHQVKTLFAMASLVICKGRIKAAMAAQKLNWDRTGASKFWEMA